MSTKKGSRATSVTSYLMAGLALALSLSGNYVFGHRMALTNEGQWWQGAAALYIDFAFVFLAACFAVLCVKKAWTLASIAAPLLFLFGAVSVYSLVCFQADERINKVRTAETNLEAQIQAVKDKNAMAFGAYERNLSWLRNRVATAPNKARRDEAKADLQKAVTEIPNVDVAEIKTLATVSASVPSEITGIDKDKLQIAFVLVVSLLVVLGKGFFGAVGGYMWASAASTAPVATEEPTTKQALPEAPKPKLRPIPYIEDDSAELAARLGPDVERHIFNRKEIQDFFSEELRPVPGAHITATDLYHRYAAYAVNNGHEVPTQNQFGRDCGELIRARGVPNLDRVQKAKGVVYTGWELRAVGGEAEAPLKRAA